MNTEQKIERDKTSETQEIETEEEAEGVVGGRKE